MQLMPDFHSNSEKFKITKMKSKDIFKKNNSKKNHTSKSFHELLEAFKKEGCPICRVVSSSIDSYFESMLYEFVNDPKVRSDLRKSLGYCKKHSNQFIKVVKKTHNKFGAFVIIEDITRELIKKLESFSKLNLNKLNKILINKKDCPACIYQSIYENIYFLDLIKILENENFLNKFLESDGLCFNHILVLLKMIKNSKLRNKIIENQKSKLGRIKRDLNAFIKKHDWQNKEKITQDEANALEKALRKISGE